MAGILDDRQRRLWRRTRWKRKSMKDAVAANSIGVSVQFQSALAHGFIDVCNAHTNWREHPVSGDHPSREAVVCRGVYRRRLSCGLPDFARYRCRNR
jgi:hypothetical protein